MLEMDGRWGWVGRPTYPREVHTQHPLCAVHPGYTPAAVIGPPHGVIHGSDLCLLVFL